MRILDNYILRDIVRVFVSTIIVFLFLYILIDAGSHIDDYLSNKVPLALILEYYLTFLPVIFVQTSPIACLLAVTFVYSSLNNSNEIIALRASGLDFWKITRPAICFGLITSAFVFMVNERFAPASASLSKEIRSSKIEPAAADKNTRLLPSIKNLFYYGMDNRIFFIDQFDPNTRSAKGFTVISQDNQQRLTEKVVALKGDWTGAAWKFTSCQITHYNPLDQSLVGDAPFFKEKIMDIKDTPDDMLRQRSSLSEMNIRDLKLYIKRFKGSGAISAVNNLRVDMHQRIAYPFACIVVILTGLPFALMSGRRKGLTFATIGVALTIGFSFYVFNAVGLALGKAGVLAPAAAAWLAPGIFTITAWFLIRELF